MPADAAALSWPGRQKPFFEKETIPAGKLPGKEARAGCCCCSTPLRATEWKPLLKKYGLLLEDNVVVDIDPLSRLMGGNYFMPVVAKYPEHAITRDFGYATMFPLCRGLAKAHPGPGRRHRELPRLHQPQFLGRDQL